MIIIPVQDTFSWRRPPVLVVLLMLINVVVYIVSERSDQPVYERLAASYFSPVIGDDADMGDLVELSNSLGEKDDTSFFKREWSAYLNFLMADDPARWQQLKLLQDLTAVSEYSLKHLWHDPHFQGYLQAYWRRHPQMSHVWQQARVEWQRELNAISHYRWGLSPSELSALTLISHQFVHSSWGHLLGNMIFLLLLGFALEKRLGASRFLTFYLMTGITAGLSHALLNLESSAPLLGASGAVSGLMGMYLAMYGRRPIVFICHIGFYAGRFRAPALIMLPLWLGKEMHGTLTGAESLVVLTHVAGLLAGCSLVLSYRLSKTSLAIQHQGTTAALAELPSKIIRQVNALRRGLALPLSRNGTKQSCELQRIAAQPIANTEIDGDVITRRLRYRQH